MSTNSAPQAQGTLGTFGGVFTPSILTILGLVLFLRVPYVVGSVGLGQALLILALSTAVSVLTSISLAVVATNIRVGGGGEYYIISRTLGIEFGGAVGVVLYLAISVSIAFYAIGFAEAIIPLFDSDSTLLIQLVAAGLVLLLAAIGFIGSDLATRLQFLVMGLLIIALASFLLGAIGDFDSSQFTDNLGPPPDGGPDNVGFWEAFAIFFPAVTGFSQGVAMSGDLATPSKSITNGTFMAVGISTVVYLATVVLLAGSATSDRLVIETNTIINDLSLIGGTMIVGVLAATLSSALASTLGSPRVLQRLGEDRVLPKLELFAVGAGPANNPRRALGISVVIALATVAVGDLNAIAPIISMFFLASYGIINYATFYEFRAGSTSFRPRFRFGDQWASLAGTILCVVVILAINPVAGLFAALVFIGLYWYLSRRTVPDRWIDSSGSYHYTQARQHVRSHAAEPQPIRDWRPCALVFVPRDPFARRRMLTMASWIEGDSGFLTAIRLLVGNGPIQRREADEVEVELRREVQELIPGSFARSLLVPDAQTGVQALIQSHGIGRIETNLTMFGVNNLRGTEEDRLKYGQMLQSSVRFGANVAVLNVRRDAWERFEATPRNERTIALWWSSDQVGQFITLLAWLCTRHEDWSDAKITAYVPQGEVDTGHVRELLEAGRITADVRAVEASPASLSNALSGATMALAPLRVRRGTAIGPFETPMGMLVESLPLAVMALATDEVELNAEPDESDLAELARLTDQLATEERKAAELDAEAGRLLVEAETFRLDAEAEPNDATLQALADEAHERARSAFRIYVNARTKTHDLQEEVAALDPAGATAELDPNIWRSASGLEKEARL